MDDILEITMVVAETFDRLGVAYVVADSLASSLHGIPRATQDVDIVADLHLGDVARFVAALRSSFYVDEDAVRTAVETRASFNVVHLTSYFKADVFVAMDDVATRLEVERGQRIALGGTPAREIRVASAEDVVARKLAWFSLGDEVSERQWDDALGVLRVAGATLDVGYLRHISALLGVEALLDRALRAAGR